MPKCPNQRSPYSRKFSHVSHSLISLFADIPPTQPHTRGRRSERAKTLVSCLGVAPSSQEGHCPLSLCLRFSLGLLPQGQRCDSSQGTNLRPWSLREPPSGLALPAHCAVTGRVACPRTAGKTMQATQPEEAPKKPRGPEAPALSSLCTPLPHASMSLSPLYVT